MSWWNRKFLWDILIALVIVGIGAAIGIIRMVG